MIRLTLAAVLYIAVGVYLAEAFRRDILQSIHYDDTDQHPPGFLGLASIVVLWLPIAVGALVVAAVRTIRSTP